jgi:hypothetical protein
VKCPICDDLEDKVVDSRMVKQAGMVRRHLNGIPPTGVALDSRKNSVILTMDGAR